MCGDININTPPDNPSSKAIEYGNMLSSYGCLNIINKFTRIRTNVNGQTSKTVIDHIITNINTNHVESGVIYYDVSDHLPIFGLFELSFDKHNKQIPIYRRFYSSAGKKKFIEDVARSMQICINKDPFL